MFRTPEQAGDKDLCHGMCSDLDEFQIVRSFTFNLLKFHYTLEKRKLTYDFGSNLTIGWDVCSFEEVIEELSDPLSCCLHIPVEVGAVVCLMVASGWLRLAEC